MGDLVNPAGRVSLTNLPTYQFTNSPARSVWVAREGLDPSKPLGRQIYSLLRLTASLPRQLVCFMETRVFGAYPDTRCTHRWSWRRDLNPRPADYKSAALPG